MVFLFFQKPTYMVFISALHTLTVHLTVRSLLDTIPGLNCLNSSFLWRNWHAGVKPVQTPVVKTVTRGEVTVQVLFYLHVPSENSHARTWFCTGENLAVDLLLGTPFRDRWIRGIFPTEWRVVPIQWQSEALFTSLRKFVSLLWEKNIRGDVNTGSAEREQFSPVK